MATVTKREIVNELSDQTGLTQNQVSGVVEAMLDVLAKHLSQGDTVTFRTFGTFEPKVAKGKIGRNPNRPENEVRIPDRCVVKFRPGRELKDQVATLSVEKVSRKRPVKD